MDGQVTPPRGRPYPAAADAERRDGAEGSASTGAARRPRRRSSAAVMLGERPGIGAVAGLLLIIAGSWLSTDGRLPRRRRTHPVAVG